MTGGTKYSKVLDASQIRIVGVFNGEGPPVPIPNTEVKLTSADNTCLETDREDRSMPTQKAHSFGCELFAFKREPDVVGLSFEVLALHRTGLCPVWSARGLA